MSPTRSAEFTNFRWPKSVLARFVARTTVRGTLIWAVVFTVSIVSTAIGFASLYPNPSARHAVVALTNNSGLDAVLGTPYRVTTPGGFTAWRSLGIVALIGGIWGLLTATRLFRGEEESGRLEMFLAGQTTTRRATLNIMKGLVACLALILVICAGALYAIHQTHGLDFSVKDSLFLGVAAVAAVAEFMAVGALTSQLAPTKRRAAAIAGGIFGVSFLIKAAADSSLNLVWLLNLTPLGWIEKIRPMTANNAWWILPPLGLTLILSAAALWLAGRRDLGDSLLIDRDTARPKISWLNRPLQLALRLQRITILSWTAGITFAGFFYGFIAKQAANALTSNKGAKKLFETVSNTGQSVAGTRLFVSVAFLIIMILLMVLTTNMVNAIREDEAKGYLDNFLVRPVRRLAWLSARLGLMLAVVAAAAICGALGAFVGTAIQHSGIGLYGLIKASINVLPAAVFLAGAGVLTFGLRPRLTASVMYGLIAWSFLLEMIGSAIKLNHYFLDFSILHHIALTPAVAANWTADAVMTALGLAMLIAGTLWFGQRDIQGE